MNHGVIELKKAAFENEVLGAPHPVVVQFWAKWSALSKEMTPLLESVADQTPVPIKIVRVNVEHHEDVTEEYGVRAVPTLLIFNRGGLQDQIIGRTTEPELREKLRRFR